MVDIREINGAITIGILDLKAFSEQENIALKRDQEKKGGLFLLKTLLGTEDFILSYLPSKKPVLEQRSEHISISHSHDKLAIIVNKQEPTGVDIELVRDKVLKVKHKFLNEAELAVAGDDCEKLITFWAAKEALYKVYGLRELDFRENLVVELIDESAISGSICTGSFKKNYRLVSEKNGEYRLVYVKHEI